MVKTGRSLSVREIRRRYDGEWGYIAEPVMDAVQNLVRGKVLFHGKDSSRVYKRVFSLKDRPSRFAMLWMGRRPSNLVVVL